MVHSVIEYRSINGFTTETYESLHKEWVKKLYHMSNKHDALKQMIQIVGISILDLESNVFEHVAT